MESPVLILPLNKANHSLCVWGLLIILKITICPCHWQKAFATIKIESSLDKAVTTVDLKKNHI